MEGRKREEEGKEAEDAETDGWMEGGREEKVGEERRGVEMKGGEGFIQPSSQCGSNQLPHWKSDREAPA